MNKFRKSPSGAGAPANKRRLPLLSRYVFFSVTLFLVILIAGGTAFLFSMRQIIRDNKGRELTKLLELERIKLEMSVDREIAIVLKMATSPLIKRHMADPADSLLKKLASDDINAYRRSLSGSVFWISDADRQFYFDDEAPYFVDIEVPENYWYSMTLWETEEYNFNINYNPDLKLTNLWINAPVFGDSGRAVGMLGTGIDLSAFVDAVYTGYTGQATFYFFNAAEEITGAKDVGLVAEKKSIREQLGVAGGDIISRRKDLAHGEVETFSAQSGQVAMICIPKLDWYAVAVWPDKLEDFNTALTVLFISGIFVVALILVLSNIFVAGLLTPLRETMQSLELASKAKSDFLARMSHEIRTPMNAIIGIVQIQFQKGNLSADIETAFDRIYNSGNMLLGIINDILDMSKIETGKLLLSPAEYDVPSLINDAVQFNIVRLGSKQIEFRLDINENLPSRLIGDEMRLKQVLNNILSNAFKYTDKGSVTLKVSHVADAGDVTLIIRVTDTGQGIRKDDLEFLFAEYQRFNEGANRHTEGTGLGLNITQRLVAMMDGTIDVESEYGKGSMFTVTVKQKAVSGAGVIGAELSERLRNFTFTGIKTSAGLKIKYDQMPYGNVLIVDDVETNLLVAEGLLSLYGLVIDTAGSGPAAIDKIKGGRKYDIVFMDHMMPGMDGVEAARKLRGLGYDGVIVALTANAIYGTEEMFSRNGFNGFVSKPIDVRKLDAVLTKFIRDKYRNDETVRMPVDEVMGEGPVSGESEPGKLAGDKPAPDGLGRGVLAPENLTPVAQPEVKPVQMNERFLKALKRDIEKSEAAMREALANNDIELFTTTVHGLKSAFAAIGEKEKSEQALALELAGRRGDREYIDTNAGKFITMLGEIIKI
ncbi:MAG: ATP-binding protein [Chitinispirillia bacterium]|nr:ATP-binding protein [Chitinispirillia bacterium]MCL2267981.1 ATP-binding protein [Chitinispirillia bacterium]